MLQFTLRIAQSYRYKSPWDTNPSLQSKMYHAFILLTITAQVLARATPLGDGLPIHLQHTSSIDHTASTSPFDIRITDTAGNDLSKQVDIIHHRSLLSTNHRHEKRARWQTLAAPAGLELLDAYCRRYISLEAYELQCRNSTDHSLVSVHRSCPPGEVCFQSSYLDEPGTGERRHNVMCVSRRDFTYLDRQSRTSQLPDPSSSSSSSSSSHDSESVGASQAGLPATGAGSSQYALEAILSAPDLHTSVNASSFKIQAQRSRNVHGHVGWQTLPGGSSQCTHCSSLEIDPVPDGTQSIALDIVMAAGAKVGTLLLGSVRV